MTTKPLRETRIILDSALAIENGCTSAIADKFVIRRVRMARSVHTSLTDSRAAIRALRDGDEALRKLQLYYDCRTFFGKPVVIDNTLEARLMIIESSEVTAEELAEAEAMRRKNTGGQ